MVLLYEHIEYMHDDYETINSRGLVAFKKKIKFQFNLIANGQRAL